MVLCKSFSRIVPLELSKPHPLPDYDQFDFAMVPYSRLDTKTLTLSQTSYFQCKTSVSIVAQHMLTKLIFYNAASKFQFLL